MTDANAQNKYDWGPSNPRAKATSIDKPHKDNVHNWRRPVIRVHNIGRVMVDPQIIQAGKNIATLGKAEVDYSLFICRHCKRRHEGQKKSVMN